MDRAGSRGRSWSRLRSVYAATTISTACPGSIRLLNASMILGGMGPVDPLKTNAGKIFASAYALYSGLALIAVVGIMLTPIFHRLMHQFHIDYKE